MDETDFVIKLFKDSIKSSSPSSEIRSPVQYDLDMPDPFCEINTSDINMILGSDQTFESILDSLRDIGEFASASPLLDCFTSDGGLFDSTESNDMTNMIQSAEECSTMIETSSSVLPVLRTHVEKTTKTPEAQPISLSNSVAVTDSARNRLQLLSPLETTFRPRYKSDYFPQNGNVRRPRYIADNGGNHFITLQMPGEYNRDLKYEFIRVALITTLIDDHEYYYSPYKFQVDHNDMKVPDQNPIYLPVQISKGSDSVKLQLVLIKSKLDQLYDAQPLKPFSDTIGSVRNIINDEKLASKDLINKYHLDKSHIAFTLCTKLANNTYDIHPETTVISTVITELPTKSPSASNTKSIPTNSVHMISCPNCKHCFDLASISTAEKGTKRKTTSHPSKVATKNTTQNRVNKKTKDV